MFGAPSGGLGASGHQGFDSATVLPTVPRNGVPLFALICFSLLVARRLRLTRGSATSKL